MANRMVPRGTVSTRTSRCRSAAFPVMTGMKSRTSHTPSGVMNRMIRIAVPGR